MGIGTRGERRCRPRRSFLFNCGASASSTTSATSTALTRRQGSGVRLPVRTKVAFLAEAGEHLIVQDTVGGQRAATPGAGLACKGGESATGFGDYGHERSHVVDLQVGFGGYVDGAFGDQHVGPEVPVGP